MPYIHLCLQSAASYIRKLIRKRKCLKIIIKLITYHHHIMYCIHIVYSRAIIFCIILKYKKNHKIAAEIIILILQINIEEDL